MADDPPFLWYYALGPDPSAFKGGFSTSEEATSVGLAEAADDYGEISIIEARSDKLRTDIFSCDQVFDDLVDLNDDLTDEDGDLGAESAPSHQRRALEDLLEAALETWLRQYGYDRTCTLSDVRTHHVLTVPGPQRE